MKTYVVYLTTMENSPEVEIISVTTSKEIADEKFKFAKECEAEYMDDREEDDGDWARASMISFDTIPGIKEGQEAFVLIMNEWCEEVITSISLFATRAEAQRWVDSYKQAVLGRGFNLEPYDEDETIEESMHLCDSSFMIDYYFSIESVIVE